MSELETLLEYSKQAHDAGNFGLASQGYAAILGTAPHSHEVWHLAGVLAHQTGRAARAIAYLERAVALKDTCTYLSDLAAVHVENGNFSAAEQFARRALAMEPDSVVVHYYLGVALARMDRVSESLAHLQHAYNGHYMVDSVLLEMAIARQALGDIKGSIAFLTRMLDRNPDEPAAYYHLSQYVLTGDYCFSPDQLARMDAQLCSLADDPASTPVTARLHYALGANFEGQAEYGRAFAHYQQANAMQHAVLEQSPKAQAFRGLPRIVDRMIAYYTPQRVQQMPCVASNSDRPVFVMGMPRSGTTLIAQALARHPDIANGGEMNAMDQALAPIRDCWDRPGGKSSDVNPMYLRRAADHYLQAIDCVDHSAARVLDKMPDNAIYLGFIRALFPSATALYCRRDPRDIAISSYSIAFRADRLKWETSDLETIAKTIRQREKMRRHWQSLFPGQITEVFYERFVANPEAESRRMLRLIGLAWSDECLSPESADGVVTTASVVQVRQPIHRRSCGRWRRFASQLQPLMDLLSFEIEQYEHDLGLVPN